MYLSGGVDRCIDRYLDRHIGRYVGRVSTEYRPSVGRELVEYGSRACRVSTALLATRGRYSLSVDRVSAECRSIVGRLSADTLPTDHVPSPASLFSGGFPKH